MAVEFLDTLPPRAGRGRPADPAWDAAINELRQNPRKHGIVATFDSSKEANKVRGNLAARADYKDEFDFSARQHNGKNVVVGTFYPGGEGKPVRTRKASTNGETASTETATETPAKGRGK